MPGDQSDTFTGTEAATRSRLRRAIILSWRDWQYLAHATWALFQARIRHATTPTGDLMSELGRVSNGLASFGISDESHNWLTRTGWSIRAAASVLPWRTDCLVQALAADQMLRDKGLQPDFYLGVDAHNTDAFAAHSWVKCCGVDVVGQTGAAFAVLLSPDQRQTPCTQPNTTG